MLKYECDVCRAINNPEETYQNAHPYVYDVEFANFSLSVRPNPTGVEAGIASGDYCGACVLRGMAELIQKMAPHLLTTQTERREWLSDYVERCEREGKEPFPSAPDEATASTEASSDMPDVRVTGEVQGTSPGECTCIWKDLLARLTAFDNSCPVHGGWGSPRPA